MLQGYFQQGMDETAVFEFFVRKFPGERNFLLAAGLEQVINFLEQLHFTPEELDFLEKTGKFTHDFIESLHHFRFTGDVHAMPEGTAFFPDEPILRITAPMLQAQLVETRIINLLQFQTLIASKAVRMKLAAPDKLLVDFGLRRAHGAEAGLFAARASYLAGFDGTSTVLAGQLYDIPIFGTMAHSFVQAHDKELDAFEHFALSQPDNAVLLIDTYDTEKAAAKVVSLAPKLQEKGIKIKAVRLDSGDLVEHSRLVRQILNNGGLQDVRIFTSGNLDEYVLKNFTDEKAPIDGFGVGTRMVTSADRPYLDCAYKLEEYADIPRRKRSEGKATWPGRKQVFRFYDDNDIMSHDILTLADDNQPGRPLIRQVMKNGKRIGTQPALRESREYALEELEKIPACFKELSQSTPYEVKVSSDLLQCTKDVDARNLAV